MPILIPRASVFHIKKEYPNTLEANLTEAFSQLWFMIALLTCVNKVARKSMNLN